MKKILMCFVLTLLTFCGSFLLSACGDKPKQLNVSFDYGYDSITNQITINAGNKVSVPQTPVRDGYEFAGWYENENLEKEFDFSKPVNQSTTIYADWVSNEIQDLFSWVEVDGGVKLSTVVGGDSTMLPQNLVVPRVIDGQKVVELENLLFQGHCYPEPYFELTTVKIPYGVTKIGDYCFKDCYNLESISIPETATSMGVGVFKMSSTSGSCLENITLPSALTTIPSEMFYNCALLESANIPSGVTSIGNQGFYGCQELKTLDLPNGLVSIGDKAFFNCSKLENLTLPNTLQSIGASAFERCFKSNFTSIPSSVTTIGDQAFAFNLTIRYLDIPTTITTMGRNVFQNCAGIILRTTLTQNAEGWNSMWNRNVTTIYDSQNNNLSDGNTYFIQNNCKYLIKTDSNDNHKYLSLEFCFKTDEKIELDTKINYNGTEYPVEEMATTSVNRFIHENVKKLIFNEGVANSKFTFGNYALNYMPNLEYIVLPTNTQPLTQTQTYKMYQNDIKVYTNLVEENVQSWVFKADTANEGQYLKPTIYTVGEWAFVDGEPTPVE